MQFLANENFLDSPAMAVVYSPHASTFAASPSFR